MADDNVNAAILEAAGAYLGLKEWPGAKHNPQVLKMYADVGQGWVKDDETAWCAAFVGSVLASLGLPHTGALNARSYIKWGYEVTLTKAKPGDVVVFWRGSPSGWQGHVAFFVRLDGSNVIVRGGNQGNAVSDAPYAINRILAVRRADLRGDVQSNRPTLRQGNGVADVFVEALQVDLRTLGYFAGKADGMFGTRTMEAVMAFQADNALATDGIVGPRTWAALAVARPRPQRDVSEADLREAGSKTIAAADTAQTGATAATVGGGVLVALDRANEVGSGLQAAQGVLQQAQALLLAYWPVLAVAALGVLIWRAAGQVKAARVQDARSGANMRR